MHRQFIFNPWLFLSIAALVADQAAKIWTLGHFSLYEIYVITSFFNWTLTYNPGAAFSFLSNASGWQMWFFSGVAAIVSVVAIIMLMTTPKQHKWHSVALSFLLAGAVGNLCDRLRLGYVIDTIQWHYQQWYWPTFNLADAFVVTAVMMWILEEVFFKRAK
jgi:signal peptidase II